MNNNKPIQPPKLAQRFLNFFLKEELTEEVLGDLEEKYLTKVQKETPQKANWNYWFQALNYLRPFAIRNDLLTQLNPFFMFRHNLKITLRKFRRNKTSFLINLVGLSTGLACALFIFMWVSDEIKVDKFHANDNRLYQVMLNLEIPEQILTLENSPVPLVNVLKEELPEVEHAVSVNYFSNWGGKKGVLAFEDRQVEAKGIHAGEDFFKIFSYPLIEGQRDEILKDKSSMLLSKSTAERLFGSAEEAMGEVLAWSHTAYKDNFKVEGIYDDLPASSTEQFDAILHFSHLIEHERFANNWRGNYCKTYFTTYANADISPINSKLENIMFEKDSINTNSSLFAVQFSDKYLYGQYENGQATGKGRISYVRLFSLIAFFLLLIACVNFMNLSTAEASLKMKEIGVKKTIGASRLTLIFQLIGESLVLSFLSLIAALSIVALILPAFNEIAGKQLHLDFKTDLILGLLSLTLFTGLISGSYPAFYLSAFKPITVLKGKLHTMLGELWIRKGLVIFQFSLSLIFIVGLLVIQQQIKYTQNKNMGYNRDNVLTFQWKGELYDRFSGLGEDGKSNAKYYAFMEGLRNLPGVVSASQMAGNIIDNVYSISNIPLKGAEADPFSVVSPVVGFDFMKTLDIELLEGRSFSRDHNDESFKQIMVNEAAARIIGKGNPVGELITINGENEIIGVVKDFHYGSLYNGIEPLVFRFDTNQGNILVKVASGNTRETIERIQKYYQSYLPGQGLEYSFLDDDYQRQYESEMRVATLSKYFAGLAIIISCLGLFGLAMFTAQRRKKEIGIRKVLGSSVFGIVQMLSKDFTKTVMAAILIAVPISYLMASNWLADFEYRIDLQWWYFVLPALIVLLIAWATVGLQTLQAAKVNPVESLKSE